MDGLHLVPVATGVSDFEAKLLAARLGADGILWQTRGIVDSIYPFGGIDVLVPRDQLADARQVLALAERPLAEPATFAGPAEDEPDGVRHTRWFGVAATGAVAAAAVVRVLALG